MPKEETEHSQQQRIAFIQQTANVITGAPRSQLLYFQYTQLPSSKLLSIWPGKKINFEKVIQNSEETKISYLIESKHIDHVPFSEWIKSPQQILNKLWNRVAFIGRLQKTLKSNRVHIAVINGLRGNTEEIAARLAGCKVVWVSRGLENCLDPGRMTLSKGIKRLRVWMHSKLAHVVVCLSEGDQQLLQRLSPRELFVIPNGVDDRLLQEFPVKEQGAGSPATLLFMMSKIHPDKGVHEMLAMVPVLKAKYPTLQILLYGQIPEEYPGAKFLMEQITKLEKQELIQFKGFTDQPLETLRASDIFCFPSKGEGAPRSILDAMLAGCSIVASDIPGIRQYVRDEQEALLVGVDDVDGYIEAIQKLLEDRGFAQALAEQSRKRLEADFTASECARRYDELLSSLG